MNQSRKIKRMAHEAGEALCSEAVCAQSRRVDKLIEKVEGEKGRNGRQA
jgi:hypothetical protein